MIQLMDLLKRVLLLISPTFRVLSGNKHRLNLLLKKTEDLQEQLSEIGCDCADLQSRQDDKNILGGKVSFLKEKKVKTYNCDAGEFLIKLKVYIAKTNIVLDVGCGIRPQTFFAPKVHICIEPFEQYRKIVRPFFPNRSFFVFLRGDALSSIRLLDDESVDSVFMIDVIEHLNKEDGFVLLREANRVARKQIIVFTPLGFYPMHFREAGGKDAWGLDGNDVQEHKSGWLPEDFGEGWDFHVCEDCHEAFLPEEKAIGKKYSGLMAIKTIKFSGFRVAEETPQFVKDVYEQRVVNKQIN